MYHLCGVLRRRVPLYRPRPHLLPAKVESHSVQGVNHQQVPTPVHLFTCVGRMHTRAHTRTASGLCGTALYCTTLTRSAFSLRLLQPFAAAVWCTSSQLLRRRRLDISWTKQAATSCGALSALWPRSPPTCCLRTRSSTRTLASSSWALHTGGQPGLCSNGQWTRGKELTHTLSLSHVHTLTNTRAHTQRAPALLPRPSLVACALWPMVAYVLPEHQLGTAYGFMQALQNLGLAVISMVAGMIVDDNVCVCVCVCVCV